MALAKDSGVAGAPAQKMSIGRMVPEDYADFLKATTARNQAISDYSSMNAHEASKIAEYELMLTLAPEKLEIFEKLLNQNEKTQKQMLKNLGYSAEDVVYAVNAYNNVTTQNTLLDPNALKTVKLSYDEQQQLYSYNPQAREQYLKIFMGDVGDNVYLTWKAAGTGDYSRTFGERIADTRTEHNMTLPYTLNPNYVPDGTVTTLKGDTVQRDKYGNLVKDATGNLVVNGGSTTGNTQNNPYLNADGSANIESISKVLQDLGYTATAPTYTRYTATDPLAGKTVEELIPIFETVKQSGFADTILNENTVNAALFGQDFKKWAADHGLDNIPSAEAAYKGAAEAANAQLDAQYQNAVNAFYQALGAQNNIVAQNLRNAAAQAQATRAATGVAAANQLSAALGQTQQTSQDALKLAHDGIDIGKQQATTLADTIKAVYDTDLATKLGVVDKKLTSDLTTTQGVAAGLGLLGQLATANADVVATQANTAMQKQEIESNSQNTINSAKSSDYGTKVGAQSYVTQQLIGSKDSQANTDANFKLGIMTAGGKIDNKGNVYDKDGKLIIPGNQKPY